jgi:Phosphotyrosyl phosphate activator (PTPA) protein
VASSSTTKELESPRMTMGPPAAVPWVNNGNRSARGTASAGIALTAAPWASHTALPPLPATPWRGQPVEEVVHAEAGLPHVSSAESHGHASTYAPASKRIHNKDDLQQFLKSDAARHFVGFILALNEAVQGKKLSDACETSPALNAFLEVGPIPWRSYGPPFARPAPSRPPILVPQTPAHAGSWSHLFPECPLPATASDSWSRLASDTGLSMLSQCVRQRAALERRP